MGVLIAAVAIMGLATRGAQAEPLTVLGGTGSVLTFDFEGDFFRFAGSTFEIVDDRNIGLVISRITSPTCDICSAGETVNASFHTPGEIPLGQGRARIGSDTYSNVTLQGTLDFNVTPVAFPTSTATFVDVSAPFTFAGTVRGLLGETEAFAVDLVGAGHTRAPYFLWSERGGYVSDLGRLDFLFEGNSAVTPEPASLLLLGGGLAAIAVKRRRRNQAPTPTA